METQVNYVQAARRRWPQARIEGEGRFAVISPGELHVRLHRDWLSAWKDSQGTGGKIVEGKSKSDLGLD